MPIMYRYIGLLAVMGILFGIGYSRGWHHSNDDFIAYQSRVTQMAKDQAAETRRKDAEHDKITNDVADSYSAALADLQSNLVRVQHRATSCSRVPENAINASATIDPDRERGGTCEGTQFYANALSCELKLKGIREWVTKQNIPVK